MADNKVTLEWDVMFCEVHLRPLKASWPAGAGAAMLGMFNAAVNDHAITTLAEGQTDRLMDVFKICKPVCCYIGDEIAKKVVECALDGKVYTPPK